MKVSKVVVGLLSLTPLLYLVWLVVGDELGSDPAKVVVDFFAITALNFLLLTLSLTPLGKFVKGVGFVKYRRMMGLYVFFYAVLHVASYLVFLADWNDLVADIYKRPYISVGFVAFLMLGLLALTSNRYSMVRLASRWKKLHQSVYLIVVLVLVHFAWQVRGDYLELFLYACLVLVLLLLRLPSRGRGVGVK